MHQNSLNQLILPLSFNRDNFFVSDANQSAVVMIDNYPKWDTPALIIIGPKASGKTHLAQILKAKDDSIQLFENIDENLDESLLFSALNNPDRKTLITTHLPLTALPIKTKDLSSRLNAQICIKIGIPDDNLIRALFIKQLADYGISASPKAISHVVNNAERSFSFIAELTEQAIKSFSIFLASGHSQKIITLPMIKDILTTTAIP